MIRVSLTTLAPTLLNRQHGELVLRSLAQPRRAIVSPSPFLSLPSFLHSLLPQWRTVIPCCRSLSTSADLSTHTHTTSCHSLLRGTSQCLAPTTDCIGSFFISASTHIIIFVLNRSLLVFFSFFLLFFLLVFLLWRWKSEKRERFVREKFQLWPWRQEVVFVVAGGGSVEKFPAAVFFILSESGKSVWQVLLLFFPPRPAPHSRTHLPDCLLNPSTTECVFVGHSFHFSYRIINKWSSGVVTKRYSRRFTNFHYYYYYSCVHEILFRVRGFKTFFTFMHTNHCSEFQFSAKAYSNLLRTLFYFFYFFIFCPTKPFLLTEWS